MSLFHAHSHPVADSAENKGRLMRLATYASVTVALVLIMTKLVAWWMTNSVAMLSSLVDSSLDMMASLVNLLAVRHALSPADREHRFGHGKAEALAGLGQALFIGASAAYLLHEAVGRLFQPQPVEAAGIGLGVMLFSIAATFGLVVFQRYVVRRTGSVAINADSLHYVGDLLGNGSVIAAIVLAGYFGFLWADGLFGLIVALIILYGAWAILRQAYDHLMDREMSDEARAQIRAIVMAHPEARAFHDLRTRVSGPDFFIQFHLELDPDMRLSRAHEVSDAIEAKLLEAFPGAQIIIHQDPEGLAEERPAFAHH